MSYAESKGRLLRGGPYFVPGGDGATRGGVAMELSSPKSLPEMAIFPSLDPSRRVVVEGELVVELSTKFTP